MTAIAPGTRIADRYVVEASIGSGGMGVVVRARDERLGRLVAVKLLPQASIGDPKARLRLIREARAAAALEHPGIVRVYDVGETEDGGAFLAMELVRGRSLRAAFVARDLEPADLARILIEVAHALSFAHDRGLVHRDVKPENIMLRDDGKPMLLDFGIAKSLSLPPEIAASPSGAVPEHALLTADGMFLGTPAYVAPEQVTLDAVDGRADEFALGVIAHEGFTGALPWAVPTPAGVISEIITPDPLTIARFGEGLEEARRVVSRALEKDPARRYPDLESFAAAIAEATGVPFTPEASIRRSGGESARSAQPPVSDMQLFATEAAVTRSSASQSKKPSEAEHAEPAKGRKKPIVLGAVGFAVGAALVTAVVVMILPPRFMRTANVLAPPKSVLACPPLEASGVAAPSGWLGAAAASLVCIRAAPILGGDPARTLDPAELLDVPSIPTDAFPAAPFDAADARARALKAAHSRAAAFVDGAVAKTRQGFHVELVLRSTDGDRATAHGEADDPSLHHAVEKAMHGIIRAAGIKPVKTIAPPFAGWIEPRIDAAQLVVDFDIATTNYEEADSSATCAEIGARRSDLTWARFARYAADCDGTHDTHMFGGARVAVDRTTNSQFSLTAFVASDQSNDPKEKRALADEAHQRFESETTSIGRADLAALESRIRQSLGDLAHARELAVAAVQAEPKHLDAWYQLVITSYGTRAQVQAASAYRAWIPWSPTGYVLLPASVDLETRLDLARRAHALVAHAIPAKTYGEALLEHGDREEARAVAVELADRPRDKVFSDLLLVRIDASEGHFRAAFDRVSEIARTMKPIPDEVTFRTELLGFGGRIARILGRPAPFADDVITRFLEPDPPVLSSQGSLASTRLIALCLAASQPVAQRCIARVRALFSSAFFEASTFASTPALLEGAERYIQGDYAGAARAWRPLLQSPETLVASLADVIADAYERTGEIDLAERADAACPPPSDTNGASLAMVRAARRAMKRGDKEQARKLATKVVEAWSLADDDVPAVAEMRALLARIGPV